MKPWQVKQWVIPEANADFVCAMEDVLSEYKQSYDEKHPRVCLDESPKQLISETRKAFAGKNGVQYMDFEYKREGVADMYMVVEPLGGRREVLIKNSHDRLNWARVITYIAEDMYRATVALMLNR